MTCGDLLLLFGEHWERQQGGSSRKHLVRKHQFTTANGWELHSYSDYGVLRRADPTWSVRRDAYRYLTKRSSLGFCAAMTVLVLIKQSLALSAKATDYRNLWGTRYNFLVFPRWEVLT